jgi:hypothetical protein
MNFSPEIVHYHNRRNDITIASRANVFCFKVCGQKTFIMIRLHPLYSWFARSRMFSRLFRLCNSAAWPLFTSDGEFDRAIIIYRYRIYVYKMGETYEVFRLPNTRVIMPGAQAVTKNGHMYIGAYCSNKSRQEPVCIYRSTDKGDTWDIVHQFPSNTVKHIHSIRWDPL